MSPTPRCDSSLEAGARFQLALFATYSYHGFINDRDGETLEWRPIIAVTPRSRTPYADSSALNHLPSGRFAANGAWLTGELARIGLGQQIVTTKTLKRRVFALARTDPLGTPIDPAWP